MKKTVSVDAEANSTKNTLNSASLNKPHYVLLDGLRGIAAFVILVFHYLEMIYQNYEDNWLGHGYLAVDFFFCLSGFVIGYAYDDRMKKIGVTHFFVNRLIRLHPLVVFGTVLGVLGYVFNPFIDNTLASGIGNVVLAAFLSMLLVPFPFLKYRGGGLFPYNTPSWSLFFEYIANVVYAFVLSRLKTVWLVVLGGVNAALLVLCAYKSGWLIGGWDISSIPEGFARVGFSFTAGLVIYRCGPIIKNRVGFLLPCLLLTGVFFFPHDTCDWITESVIVILIFPLIISLGAGTTVRGRTKYMLDFMGKLSYPLYMTHITTVWLFGNYYRTYNPAGMQLVGIVVALVVFNLLVAVITLRWIDEPLRKWLGKKQKNGGLKRF